jgi:phosphonate dehydrogenase
VTAKPKVLVTHWVHPDVVTRLASSCETIANGSRGSWPRERVLDLASGCDGLMAFTPDRIDEAFLERCPKLRVVAAATTGAGNFDLEACARRGVWLAQAPGLVAVPTAELAMGLLLAVARNLRAADDHVRSGAFRGWRPQVGGGTGLAGKTLGVIGYGAIGRLVAQRAAAFDMTVIYADPQPGPGPYQRVPLGELLARSDVVMPLVPLTLETRHMIDARALALMKRGALVVNVGRGSVVDEAAVAASLASGHLAGYAADVFEMEDWAALDTCPGSIHPGLLADRKRTLLTPHLGSAVDDPCRTTALEAADNILDALAGRTPRGAINAARLS